MDACKGVCRGTLALNSRRMRVCPIASICIFVFLDLVDVPVPGSNQGQAPASYFYTIIGIRQSVVIVVDLFASPFLSVFALACPLP